MHISEREARLAQKLTPEFLETLLEAGKVVGWGIDYVELRDFIRSVYYLAGKQAPTDEEMKPYDEE